MVTTNETTNVTDEELEFREALGLVLTGRRHDGPTANLDREIVITPYDGAYGQAGVVIAINGSPPVGLLLVITDQMQKTVFVFRRPYRPGSVIEIRDPAAHTQVGKDRARLHHAALAYLEVMRGET